MKKKLLITLFTLFLCVILTGCSKTMKINETATIKADNIKLTVLGSEKVSIDEGELSISNGDYIKVKITLENIGNDTYTWTSLNFSLGDKIPSLSHLGQTDVLKNNISAGETVTGYIYFPVTDSEILTYTSKMEAVSSDKVKVENVEFKIK